MVDFNPISSYNPLSSTSGVNSQKTGATGSSGADAPLVLDPKNEELQNILAELGLPEIPLSSSPLSLDTLINAIGDDVRRQACRDGVSSLELKAEQQAEVNEKELQEIADRLEEMKKKSVLNGFLKAFKIIGAIVGAIASVASIVAGALTANPLLIAAGAVGLVSTVDSVVSLASDGKYSIAAGFTELGKKLGMSDEAAQWFGFGMNMAIMVVSIGVSLARALPPAPEAWPASAVRPRRRPRRSRRCLQGHQHRLRRHQHRHRRRHHRRSRHRLQDLQQSGGQQGA